MIKKITTIGVVVGLFAALAFPVLAHPGDPDYNFAVFNARGGDCETIQWFLLEQVHDASGNTYASQAEACLSGGPIFWSGSAH